MSVAIERSASHFALVGTPNSGKTALFNALTGGRQKVANYPGVTVERKTGAIQTPAGNRVILIDLPGTYSLRGRSPDEEITRDVILGRLTSEPPPDLLLCVADATNLRVALRLVIELKKVGRPLLLVLNMIDIARRSHARVGLCRRFRYLQCRRRPDGLIIPSCRSRQLIQSRTKIIGMWREQGKHAEASRSPCGGWRMFSEGFDILDPKKEDPLAGSRASQMAT